MSIEVATATRPLAGPLAGRRTLALLTGHGPHPCGHPPVPRPAAKSVTRRVHDDPAAVIGALRAVLLEMMHPLVMAGFADHVAADRDPLWRLTAIVELTEHFAVGGVDAAEDALRAMREAHAKVTGRAPDGRAYTADDPELLTWVHHVVVDSFLRAAQRYGRHRFDAAQADRYVAEMAVLGEACGAKPARNRDALRHALQTARSDLMPTPAARRHAHRLFAPDLPFAMRPAYGVVIAAAVGLLPRSVRRELWVPVAPLADPTVIRPSATITIRLLDVVPRWVASVAGTS